MVASVDSFLIKFANFVVALVTVTAGATREGIIFLVRLERLVGDRIECELVTLPRFACLLASMFGIVVSELLYFGVCLG